jgi:hypothetical protein
MATILTLIKKGVYMDYDKYNHIRINLDKQEIHFRGSNFSDVYDFVKEVTGCTAAVMTNFLKNKNKGITWVQNGPNNKFSSIGVIYMDSNQVSKNFFGETMTVFNRIGDVAKNTWNIFIHYNFSLKGIAELAATRVDVIKPYLETIEPDFIYGRIGNQVPVYSEQTLESLILTQSFKEKVLSLQDKRPTDTIYKQVLYKQESETNQLF